MASIPPTATDRIEFQSFNTNKYGQTSDNYMSPPLELSPRSSQKHKTQNIHASMPNQDIQQLLKEYKTYNHNNAYAQNDQMKPQFRKQASHMHTLQMNSNVNLESGRITN